MNKRLIYTFVFSSIFIVVAIGVFYALTPGVAPNPGHKIDQQVSIPSGCQANQFLQWDGNEWFCFTICPSGTHVVTTTYTNEFEDNYSATTSLSCSGTLPADTCDGSQTSAYTCLPSDSKTCIDIYKRQGGGNLGAWICTTRDITCEKAAMLCGE